MPQARAVTVSVAILAVCGVLVSAGAAAFVPGRTSRVKLNINKDWKFLKSNPANAQTPSFNDASWEKVGTPHTFNDLDVFDNVDGGCGDHWTGIVWYRKHFTVSETYRGRCMYIEFEGVSSTADVWLNGTKLGQNCGGAVPFVFRIDSLCTYGTAENILAVKVDNEYVTDLPGDGGLPYSTHRMGGIVRDVWLHVMDKVHIPLNVYSFQNTWGTYVGATKVSIPDYAEISMSCRVKNTDASAKTCRLIFSIVDQANAIAGSVEQQQIIAAGAQYEFFGLINLNYPKFWEPSNPYLYRVVTSVSVNGTIIDEVETPLGIRSIRFDANGFYLNGKSFKLRGATIRQTPYPGLGNAVSNYLHAKDVRILRELGGNFVRTGHSAMDPAVMEAGDRHGVMFMDAGQAAEGSPPFTQEYSMWYNNKFRTMRDAVIRDRNHPSVILWELHNGWIDVTAAGMLIDTIKKYDPLFTRPTTAAAMAADQIPRALIDVIGTHGGGNGSWNDGYAGKPLVMCEWGWGGGNAYRIDGWNMSANYAIDFLNGLYLMNNFEEASEWAGYVIETLVESPMECQNVYHSNIPGPCARFGILDPNGRIFKEPAYAFQGAWSSKPHVHISGHWTDWDTSRVVVFANPLVDSVTLTINGQAVQTKAPRLDWGSRQPFCGYTIFNNITYAPGTLVALGINKDRSVVTSDTVRTVGAPAKIILTADPPVIAADRSEASCIIATVTDANGNAHPTAGNSITFSVTGPGNYRGGFNHLVNNSTGKPTLVAEMGKIAVTVRSTDQPGVVAVTASSPGLQSGSVQIQSVVAEDIVGIRAPRTATAPPSPAQPPTIRVHDQTIVVANPSRQWVSLELTAPNGRTVAALAHGPLSAGTHRFPLSLRSSGSARAVLLVVVETRGNQTVRKVVLGRGAAADDSR